MFKGVVKRYFKTDTCFQVAIFRAVSASLFFFLLDSSYILWLLLRDLYLHYLMRVLPLKNESTFMMCYINFLNCFYVTFHFCLPFKSRSREIIITRIKFLWCFDEMTEKRRDQEVGIKKKHIFTHFTHISQLGRKLHWNITTECF